jgi:hypothetical protein
MDGEVYSWGNPGEECLGRSSVDPPGDVNEGLMQCTPSPVVGFNTQDGPRRSYFRGRSEQLLRKLLVGIATVWLSQLITKSTLGVSAQPVRQDTRAYATKISLFQQSWIFRSTLVRAHLPTRFRGAVSIRSFSASRARRLIHWNPCSLEMVRISCMFSRTSHEKTKPCCLLPLLLPKPVAPIAVASTKPCCRLLSFPFRQAVTKRQLTKWNQVSARNGSGTKTRRNQQPRNGRSLRHRRRPAIAVSLSSSFDELATDGDMFSIESAPTEWSATMSMILISTVNDSIDILYGPQNCHPHGARGLRRDQQSGDRCTPKLVGLQLSSTIRDYTRHFCENCSV